MYREEGFEGVKNLLKRALESKRMSDSIFLRIWIFIHHIAPAIVLFFLAPLVAEFLIVLIAVTAGRLTAAEHQGKRAIQSSNYR